MSCQCKWVAIADILDFHGNSTVWNQSQADGMNRSANYDRLRANACIFYGLVGQIPSDGGIKRLHGEHRCGFLSNAACCRRRCLLQYKGDIDLLGNITPNSFKTSIHILTTFRLKQKHSKMQRYTIT